MKKAVKNKVTKNKRVPPEEWAPGRTLDSARKLHLTATDIAKAQQLVGVMDETAKSRMAENLQSIARCYWEQKRDWERPAAQWYQTRVGKIARHVEGALQALREAKGTALSQLKVQTRRHLDRPLLAAHDTLSIEQLLEDFAAACHACKYPSVRGAPERIYIKRAVTALRQVWIDTTGKKFPLNLETGNDGKDRDRRSASESEIRKVFISQGPLFIQTVMKGIDPDVSVSSIAGALREAPVNARLVD